MKQSNYRRGVRLRPALDAGGRYWYAWSINCRIQSNDCVMPDPHPMHAKTRHQLIERVDQVLNKLGV
ncbi:hypothetical protein LCGC14_0595090 [marine sediment metagenome]|uniref:Uncharacterized protein n=1 Tax=marine sediment metagenome TaxID=412755 RepID=A0A0F9RC91_9ZZZZ